MRIAITLGDPNGIGPEIAIKAAQHFANHSTIRPLLVGDGFVIEDTANRFGLDSTPPFFDAAVLDEAGYAPGTLDPRAGKATVGYVEAAVRLVREGKADAIIGCPHSETAVNRAGIAFSGYPGLVADLTGTPRDRAFMMLAAQGLKIVHTTLHESVATALARLSPELVIAAAEAIVAVAQRLGDKPPTIGVFGINPHAGEDGLFGDDDERITKPAVAALKARGIAADGPAGGDLLLSRRRHDVYLAMFHDQGHIPIKLISPLRASAMTIGVPVLFASVARGCAFDIAGKGVADPTGVIETVGLLAGVSSSFFGAKFSRAVEEMLVSPMPNWVMLLGYVTGAVARGLVVGALVLLIALFFTDLHVAHPIITFLSVLLGATVFSLAGFVNAVFAKKFDDIALVPTFVLTPLTYLGGVFYSVDLLGQPWRSISMINPILYMVNAFRYGVLGVSDVQIGVAFAVMLVFVIGLTAVALHLLKRGVGMRS